MVLWQGVHQANLCVYIWILKFSNRTILVIDLLCFVIKVNSNNDKILLMVVAFVCQLKLYQSVLWQNNGHTDIILICIVQHFFEILMSGVATLETPEYIWGWLARRFCPYCSPIWLWWVWCYEMWEQVSSPIWQLCPVHVQQSHWRMYPRSGKRAQRMEWGQHYPYCLCQG